MKILCFAALTAALLSPFTTIAQEATNMPLLHAKKILVVYYSRTNHTARVAKDIASALNADIERVIDLKTRTGFFAAIGAGRDAMNKKMTKIGALQKDPANYDLIVAGTPIWGWNMTPAIRTYLEMNKGALKSIAYFVTAGGTKVEKILPGFKEITGKTPVAYVGFVQKELKEEKAYREKLGKFIEALKE